MADKNGSVMWGDCTISAGPGPDPESARSVGAPKYRSGLEAWLPQATTPPYPVLGISPVEPTALKASEVLASYISALEEAVERKHKERKMFQNRIDDLNRKIENDLAGIANLKNTLKVVFQSEEPKKYGPF